MKVKIRDVPRSGMDYEAEVLPPGIELQEEPFDLEKEILLRGRLERVDNFILARIQVSYTIDTICARCLDNINKTLDVFLEFDMEFQPGDEYVDLGARVREELLMQPHARVLCQESCRGICLGCGAYLNEESCECQKGKDLSGDNNKE